MTSAICKRHEDAIAVSGQQRDQADEQSGDLQRATHVPRHGVAVDDREGELLPVGGCRRLRIEVERPDRLAGDRGLADPPAHTFALAVPADGDRRELSGPAAVHPDLCAGDHRVAVVGDHESPRVEVARVELRLANERPDGRAVRIGRWPDDGELGRHARNLAPAAGPDCRGRSHLVRRSRSPGRPLALPRGQARCEPYGRPPRRSRSHLAATAAGSPG